ncbi:hypothetical protein HQ535_12265 [bacterium]|nr:hypothetical protein [bacterium]
MPTKIVFCIAVALIVVGVIAFYGDFLDSGKHVAFWASIGGGVLLALGSALKGFQPRHHSIYEGPLTGALRFPIPNLAIDPKPRRQSGCVVAGSCRLSDLPAFVPGHDR